MATRDEELLEILRSERIKRYGDLPSFTQEWIANLREEDIQELEDVRKFMRSVKTLGTIWKVVFFAFFSAVIVVGPAFDYLSRFWKWINQ